MKFELKKTGRALALTSALVAAVSLSAIPGTAQAQWYGGGHGWHGGWHGGGWHRGGWGGVGLGLAAGALAGAAIASSAYPYYGYGYGYGYPYYSYPSYGPSPYYYDGY